MDVRAGTWFLFVVGWLGVCWMGQPAAGAGKVQPPAPPWWQRGQDTWYYKDDWKALYLETGRQCRKSIELPAGEKIRAAFAYVWGAGAYTFKVNGRVVGSDCDAGTIEDHDLTRLLRPGANTIEIEGAGERICEGAAVLASGREIHFATDASWSSRPVETSRVRRRGPRGYAGDSHMARMVAVTAEQKAKLAVNHIHSVRKRILSRDQYLFWKHRDPREVLRLGQPTEVQKAWTRIERLLAEAQSPAGEAGKLVLAGKFAQAQEAVAPARQATDEAEKILQGLMDSLRAAERARAKALRSAFFGRGGREPTFNRSDHNRLGWVASCEPLDNDPAYWELDIAPPVARSIALAGLWRFKTDPADEGVKLGFHKPGFDDAKWRTIYAPSKWGWERHGVTAHNPNLRRGWNKPYNGLAWYRKAIGVPAAWKGKDLVLRLGPRWNNSDWLAVNGKFVEEPAGQGSRADEIAIPARLVQPGKVNTLALRVLNHDNVGGIINPGLRLSVSGARPLVRRHICGPGAVRQTVFQTAGGPVEQRIYSSALSPGVIAATAGRVIRLGSWGARGFERPTHCTFQTARGSVTRPLAKGALAKPDELKANSLLLTCASKSAGAARPLAIVLEWRPEAVEVVEDGFGGLAVVLRFARAGARIGLVRLDGDRAKDAPFWAKAMLRYPVAYLEQIAFAGGTCKVRMAYEFLAIEDHWKTKPTTLAPLPMLFSYAMEHNWPAAKVEGKAAELHLRADSGPYPGGECGAYRAALDAAAIAYSYDRLEPEVRYRGYGTLNEEVRLGEPMYANMSKWSANCYRPQLALPKLADFGDPKKMARFDTMFNFCRKYRLTCFLNWFTGQGLSGARQKDFLARWAGMARYCKDFPQSLVVYDLINEPAHFRWDDYNRFVKEVVQAIRAVDKVHWISVESGGGWAQPEDLDMLQPTGDEKTIYQFHFYGPHTGDVYRPSLWYPRYQTDEQRFRSYEGWEERMLSPIRFGIRHQAELMHGELGISFLGPGESPRAWLQDVLGIHEKYRMHWCWWNYSGSDICRTGLIAADRVNPLVPTLVKFAKMPAPD